MSGHEARTVLVYRDDLLPASESFITAQAGSLQRFSPLYVGTRVILPCAAPSPRVELLPPGSTRLRTAAHRLWPSVARASVAALSSHSPALVHAHFGPDGVQAMRLAEQLEVPLVVTFHGYDVTWSDVALRRSGLRNRLYVARRLELSRRAARVIAVSDFVRDRLVNLGFPPEKINRHYIGVDTRFFVPGSPALRKHQVLFVGRLVESKGADLLIRAMSVVQRQHAEAELLMVGDGPARAELEASAQASRVRVRFLGVQPRDAVRDLMQQASVFSVPSVTTASGASEAFGMVFAEAQATGLPVVSFKTGGIPEAVADGETGCLVEERDWLALADRISRLLDDEALARTFGTAGRARVERQFDLVTQGKALEEIYDGVLAGNLSGGSGFIRPGLGAIR